MNICLFTPEEISRPLKASDSRAVHLKKILHKKEGDAFAAGIIEGPAGTATIAKIGGDGSVLFDFVPQSDGKPLFPLDMIIGFPRPIQLKRLLRDMAALGVQSVRLAGTELGEKSYLKSRLSEPEEIYKMLLDGTVQAGSTRVPKIFVYPSLAECLDKIESDGAAAEASAERNQNASSLKIALDNIAPAQSLKSFLCQNPPKGRRAFAAIGSERGWSPRERALLEQKGFVRLGMGPRVMRAETAATVSASVILSEMGALE